MAFSLRGTNRNMKWVEEEETEAEEEEGGGPRSEKHHGCSLRILSLSLSLFF